MRLKAQLVLDEDVSWSLLWYLFGKGTEDIPKELILFPSTSHLEACQFVADDLIAQLCLQIVQWLEGLTSKALDLERKVRESSFSPFIPISHALYIVYGLLNPINPYLKPYTQTPLCHLTLAALIKEFGFGYTWCTLCASFSFIKVLSGL